jgi:hypothetical protein
LESRDQLRTLSVEADELLKLEFDNHRLKQWQLSVQAILEARFGDKHRLVLQFQELQFRASEMASILGYEPAPSRSTHNQRYQQDLLTGKSIIEAGVAVWSTGAPSKPDTASRPRGHVLEIHNTNTNTANSTSSSNALAEAYVEFPLSRLLSMVDNNSSYGTDQERNQAKEHLEDLEGELKKPNPRWDKIKGALQYLLDGGKDLAVEVMGAVIAHKLTGG